MSYRYRSKTILIKILIFQTHQHHWIPILKILNSFYKQIKKLKAFEKKKNDELSHWHLDCCTIPTKIFIFRRDQRNHSIKFLNYPWIDFQIVYITQTAGSELRGFA